MRSKCTLLIDGNWLLISRYSVMTQLFSMSNTEEDLEFATEKLKDMMARSINVILNRFPMIDNMIFISDGGSWRKQLPVPRQLEDITYKGNRVDEKSQAVSWKHVFNALNQLSDNCRELGVTTCTQTNIEGDDWVWYWSRRLNEQGINCLIWSSDHDLMQLIQSRNDSMTAWLYDRSGKSELALHESLEIKEPEPGDLDFFMRPMQFKPRIIEEMEKKVKTTTYTDPNTIINEKVICGDSGDNIKPVARIVKNGKRYGVGKKEWEKIANKLDITTIYDLIDKKSRVAGEISNMSKFDSKIKAEMIEEMIDYNIKLVWLNEQVIPETVIAIMNQQEYKQVDVNYIRGSYTVLLGDFSDVKNIFESI